MDALRQSEKHREKTRQDTETIPTAAVQPPPAPAPLDLALEPAHNIPEHMAQTLDEIPDSDVVDDPALTHGLDLEPNTDSIRKHAPYTPVTAPLKSRHGLDAPWLLGVAAVLSIASLTTAYYYWRMRDSTNVSQAALLAPPVDLSIWPAAPAEAARTAKPLVEEPARIPVAASGPPLNPDATPAPRSEPAARSSDQGTATAQIEVRRTQRTDPQTRILDQAYADYQAGRLQDAATGYRDILSRFPLNRDALLGVAAIALRDGNRDEAQTYYRRVIELYPGDSVARSALMDIAGNEDAGEAASTLKYWLQNASGNAALQFALGNQYARTGNWRDAQDAYFQASTAAADNADYAFNLAISLDHLDKPALALEQYRRALTLAGRSANVGFDRQAAAARVESLTAAAGGDNR